MDSNLTGGTPLTTNATVAPYGSWESPITSDLIVSSTVGLAGAFRDGQRFFWLESRPWEKGRTVLVERLASGAAVDVTPADFNIRNKVHEYGGAAAIVRDGVVYFSNFVDQRLYRQHVGELPTPITPDEPLRYADGVLDVSRARGIWVLEDHRGEGEAANSIAAVPLAGGEPVVLVQGNDFYSAPRLSPDGSRLSWLTWNHPNMPWDGCELWVANLDGPGAIRNAHKVAGGLEESVFQPAWSPDGTLHFASDRTGWWNLYRVGADGVEPLVPMEAEFGMPYWQFGMATYTFERITNDRTRDGRRIVATYRLRDGWHLATIDASTKAFTEVETPFTSFRSLSARDGVLTAIVASPVEMSAIVEIQLDSGRHEVVKRSGSVDVLEEYFSIPEAVEFPTEGGLTAHAFYYPPTNPRFTAPEGEKPPLVVKSHGGPTSATESTLELRIQYWTSRGFAVLDVNYGGSTGYGRTYRERLKGQWGIVDVDDCANGARYLVQRGLADPNRLAITGGSAGGYTTLAALTFRDVFKAGASHYGISDCEALATDTHKFESRYLDGLIGPYPARRDLYLERSPIHHTEGLSCPIAFFQGLEDEIVPPDQAERMVDALRKKGLPVAYLAFEGEQHGFRQSQNIKAALDGELYFYGKIFGFEPAGSIKPIPIENL